MSIRRREHRHGRSYKGLHTDCNLPQAEWILLMNEVKEAVRDPINSVVLEDPKHSNRWETWLDDFIDGGICERFFGAGMGKKWDFVMDRTAIRTFMRLLVLLAASRERTSNRRSTNLDLRKEDPPAAATPKVTDFQGGLRIQENSREIMEYANTKEGGRIAKTRIKEEQGTPNERDSLLGDITSPNYYATIFEKPSNTEYVFQTRLSGSNKVKFLYTNDKTSLQSFLEEVHSKFSLGHDQGIESFEAQIGGNTYVVDTPDERDWQQIMKIVRDTSVAADIVAKVLNL